MAQPATSMADGLRIGLIAPPWLPVPPTVYGGTELVVADLATGLARAGCQVELFTTGDSTCPVRRRWLYPASLGTQADPRRELAHVARAHAELAGVDVIHDHTLAGPLWSDVGLTGPPVVTTVHSELVAGLQSQYASAAERVAVVAVSHAQRRSAPDVPISAVIHHGIDVHAAPFGDGRGGYVLFLGRMSPDKGVHRAIRVARAAGRRILIAAKMWQPAEHRYFTEAVEPLLGTDATYLGEVGTTEKLALLCEAEALVNPIRWNEPFGLVMIEALACGTPVLAFAEGAAPELIEHGRTGYLCLDEADMARRLGAIGDLDRAACRTSAETRFSLTRMVAEYLDLYRRVLADPPTSRQRSQAHVIDLRGVEAARAGGPTTATGVGAPGWPTSGRAS